MNRAKTSVGKNSRVEPHQVRNRPQRPFGLVVRRYRKSSASSGLRPTRHPRARACCLRALTRTATMGRRKEASSTDTGEAAERGEKETSYCLVRDLPGRVVERLFPCGTRSVSSTRPERWRWPTRASPRARARARGVLTIRNARDRGCRVRVFALPKRTPGGAGERRRFCTDPNATRAGWPTPARFRVNGPFRASFRAPGARASRRLAEVLARDASRRPRFSSGATSNDHTDDGRTIFPRLERLTRAPVLPASSNVERNVERNRTRKTFFVSSSSFFVARGRAPRDAEL